MRDYPGQDNAGTPTDGAYIPDKGYWPTPEIPSTDDARDEINSSAGIEGAVDRTVWLAHRFVNGLEGSPDGAPYPGAISWGGAHRFQSSTPTYFEKGPTVNSGTTQLKSTEVAGTLTVSSGLSLPAGCVTQVADAMIRTGDDAYQAGRAVVVTAGNKTLQPWKNDYWASVAQGSAVEWTLDDPPAAGNVEFSLIHAGSGSNIVVKRSNGSTVATMGVGLYKSLRIAWILTSYEVVESHS